MRIQIKLLATYRQYLPPGSAASSYDVEVPPGTRVDDLLPQLPAPSDGSVVLVNGRGSRPGQVLQEGDVVCLFPAIAGG